MEKLRIGILGPSDIALRRFIPALIQSESAELAGIASASADERGVPIDRSAIEISRAKVRELADCYGICHYDSYEELLGSKLIDAIYIPLPPALHVLWATKALAAKKHVLLEKPFTTNYSDTKKLIEIANIHHLALHENYAFVYHRQFAEVQNIIAAKEIGEIRLIKAAFGFPYRGEHDFRYHADKGGGALLDCGGYPIKLASVLLGLETQIETASLQRARGHDVDVFGSVSMKNHKGTVAQLAFGMDNFYCCNLEVWGSTGYLSADRIFTPTASMETEIVIVNSEVNRITISPSDQFLYSIEYFVKCAADQTFAETHHEEIAQQALLVDRVRAICK